MHLHHRLQTFDQLHRSENLRTLLGKISKAPVFHFQPKQVPKESVWYNLSSPFLSRLHSVSYTTFLACRFSSSTIAAAVGCSFRSKDLQVLADLLQLAVPPVAKATTSVKSGFERFADTTPHNHHFPFLTLIPTSYHTWHSTSLLGYHVSFLWSPMDVTANSAPIQEIPCRTIQPKHLD